MLKKLSNQTLAAMLVAGFTSPVAALPISFGAADNYNVFVKNDFSATSSDVEGRVAVGGNASISNYSINVKNGVQLYSDTSSNPALVVGGGLNYTSGNIAGDVYVGGVFNGSASGTITNGSLQSGGLSPIDFDSEFAALEQLSLDLSLLNDNGVATPQWSTQNYYGEGQNGVGSDWHVFDLTGDDMMFTDYLLRDVDAEDFILFNVSGSNISTSWGNFAGSDNSLRMQSDRVLYNFFEAEVLEVNAALFGSILAPNASVLAAYGLIEGQVIADSWLGNAQVNDNPFITSPVSVSAPGSLGLLSLGLLGLAVIRKRR